MQTDEDFEQNCAENQQIEKSIQTEQIQQNCAKTQTQKIEQNCVSVQTEIFKQNSVSIQTEKIQQNFVATQTKLKQIVSVNMQTSKLKNIEKKGKEMSGEGQCIQKEKKKFFHVKTQTQFKVVVQTEVLDASSIAQGISENENDQRHQNNEFVRIQIER